MADWEIDRPVGVCQGTGEKIEYGQDYYATLMETEEGLKRHDFCLDYWESEKPEVFCYWKSRLVEPDKKKRIFVDDEMLMSFFVRLGEETDQQKINFRFVLLLILMRKRRLKYDSSRAKDGREMWRMRVVGGDFIEVENPHLNEDQIEQMSSQLGEILQADLQNE